MISNKSFCIYASNIAGIGSTIVVTNILHSFLKHEELSNAEVFLYLPDIPYWSNFVKNFNCNWKIVFVKRSKFKYIRYLNRVIDILIGHRNIPKVDNLIVLGDFPLRFKQRQIVLFHNLNLTNDTSNFEFIFHKLFFTLNLQYISKCVVQSDIVKNNILNKFPFLKDKVQVLPMPVDEIYEKNKQYNKILKHKLECFYPASFYAHKNHKVIIDLCNTNNCDSNKFHFYFTLPRNLNKDLGLTKISLITNLGPLTKFEVYNKFKEVDVLVFPSLLESYGLPLIEAMKMNLYIVCADLPYARWLCGEQAKYFDPLDPDSLKLELEKVFLEKSKNIKPDWTHALLKIPNNWISYSRQFLN